MSSQSVFQECQVRVAFKSVKSEWLSRVSSKKCQVRVSYKSVKCKSVGEEVSSKKCQTRVSEKSVSQARMSRVSSKSVPEECQARSVLQEC